MKLFYSRISAIIVICCAGILIYSNTLHSSFHFDDEAYIVDNLALRNIRDLRGIWDFYPSRFITFLTFALNYRLHQLNVFGYHLVNLAAHLGAAISLWWFIQLIFATPALKGNRRLVDTRWIALFAALIFLSHPLQTEAVTYIWQRCTVLAGFLYLLALGLYLKSRLLETEDSAPLAWRPFYFSAWLVAFLAMFIKENAVTLPLMLLLCELSFFKPARYMNWRRVLPFLFLLAVVPALLFLAKPETFNFVRRLGQQPISAGGEYFLTELRVIVTYLRLLFVPLKQNLDYDYPAASGLNLAILGSIFILAVIIASAIRLWTRYRILSFAIFWFFLTLLPDSSIIPLDDVIFEHRLYLAAVGYGIFLTAALNYLLKERAPKLLLGILSLLVIAYSLQAYQRNKVWKDELSLWNDAVFKSPRKSRPYSNRGLAYFKKGDFKRAFSDYLKAIQLDPNSAEAYNNRGLAYEGQGDFKQAVSDYTRAIEIRPKYVNSRAYYNRGHAYQSQGKFDEALSDYSEAIRLSPNFAQAYVNRGLIYRGQGNFEQAILDYNKAIQLNLNFAEAYNNRGFAYHGQGDLKQAIADYNKAIAINPNLAQALQNRAIAYFHQKEYVKSWEDVRKAEALGYEVNSDFLEDLKKASRSSVLAVER